jgi:hypothetical protein
MWGRYFLCLATGCCLLGADVARAQGPTPVLFGQRGQFVVSSELWVNYEDRDVDGKAESDFGEIERVSVGGSGVNVTTVPALDYFLTENLSVGAAISVTHSGPGISLRSSLAEDGEGASVSGDSFKVGFGPRVGYAIRISDAFTLFPRFGFRVAFESIELEGATATSGDKIDVDITSLDFNGFAPLMWHPVNHFFIGVGPSFTYQFWSDGSVSERLESGLDGSPFLGHEVDIDGTLFSIGVATQIGGYW